MKKEPNLARRILIYATMAFCMTLIVWMAWNGRDNSDIHKLIVDGCFFSMNLLVLFYVLGANIDLALNILAARFGSGQQAPPQRREADRPVPRVPLRGDPRDRDRHAPSPSRHHPDDDIE